VNALDEGHATGVALVMSAQAKRRKTMDTTAPTTYLDEVQAILDASLYEYCEVCGQDIAGHAIAPDVLGHAHSYCLTGPDAAKVVPIGS
jgi:hypothetical protein